MARRTTKKKAASGGGLKKSVRTDSETIAKKQNQKLVQHLTVGGWEDFAIHRIERIERENPNAVRTGWRAYYEE